MTISPAPEPCQGIERRRDTRLETFRPAGTYYSTDGASSLSAVARSKNISEELK